MSQDRQNYSDTSQTYQRQLQLPYSNQPHREDDFRPDCPEYMTLDDLLEGAEESAAIPDLLRELGRPERVQRRREEELRRAADVAKFWHCVVGAEPLDLFD